MFPLRDDNPTEIVPFFTTGLILASPGVRVGVEGGGFDPVVLRASVCEWGVIPGQVKGSPSSHALPPGLECGEGGGAQIWADPGSPLPMVGASGTISGIMGAYLVLYPKARVSILFIIMVFIQVAWVPAWVMLGYWFLIQLLVGASQAPGVGGVAFWAHAGGFLAGVLLVKPFENRTLSNAKRARVHLSRGEIPRGGWW